MRCSTRRRNGVALGQPFGGGRLHQAARAQPLQAAQRRARADLRVLAAAHHQHQLHDELDLADAAARQLDVVGALRPAGGAALRLVADLAVQLAQAFEHAVVQVAAVDERRDQLAQRQRTAAGDAGARRDDAALQPGKALPFAALHLQVVLQHRQAAHRRAGVAVGPQRQVDAEDEAVLGGVADQRVQLLRHQREELVRADALRSGWSRPRPRRRRSGRCRRTRSARARRACPCRRSRTRCAGLVRPAARRGVLRCRPAPAPVPVRAWLRPAPSCRG